MRRWTTHRRGGKGAWTFLARTATAPTGPATNSPPMEARSAQPTSPAVRPTVAAEKGASPPERVRRGGTTPSSVAPSRSEEGMAPLVRTRSCPAPRTDTANSQSAPARSAPPGCAVGRPAVAAEKGAELLAGQRPLRSGTPSTNAPPTAASSAPRGSAVGPPAVAAEKRAQPGVVAKEVRGRLPGGRRPSRSAPPSAGWDAGSVRAPGLGPRGPGANLPFAGASWVAGDGRPWPRAGGSAPGPREKGPGPGGPGTTVRSRSSGASAAPAQPQRPPAPWSPTPRRPGDGRRRAPAW
jgi:hypothetical protein